MYTDSVGESVSRVWDSDVMTNSFRIPPDGMESAALLKHESNTQHQQGGGQIS